MTEIKPASFGLSVISGKTGKLVRVGQDIVDGRKTRFTHAYFVLDNNEILQAEPGGAEIVSVDEYLSRPQDTVLWSDRPVQQFMRHMDGILNTFHADKVAYEALVRSKLVKFGRDLGPGGRFGEKGVPYNYLDYLAIGLEHFHINLPPIRHRVRREDRMICSQLVDFIYSKNGIRLFDDGRMPQDVTPGDLEQYATA